MKIYSIHQAKTQLSKLIQKALHGEEVIIANGRKPIIRLTVLEAPKRRLGFMEGVRLSADFNKPLKEFKEYQ